MPVAILKTSVKRIVKLESDPIGQTVPVVIYGDPVVDRNTSKKYRNMEKVVVRLMKAQNVFATTYLDRHRMSSVEKKNGWKKDLGKNLSKAFKAGKRRGKFKLKVI